MPDTDKLPALLRLYDDDSETVRETVARELASFGDDLENLMRGLPDPPDDPTIVAVLQTVRGAGSDSHDVQTAAAELEPETETETTSAPRFREGQLVQHRRYGYRGIVVSFDEHCQASDAWYERNRTQPDREQPWYHVLVDGSDQVTYAAQTSLAPDATMDPVRHPLLPFFFEETDEGRYVRNARPWPTVD